MYASSTDTAFFASPVSNRSFAASYQQAPSCSTQQDSFSLVVISNDSSAQSTDVGLVHALRSVSVTSSCNGSAMDPESDPNLFSMIHRSQTG